MYKYNIKDFRQACGFTQAELAERVGCDQPMIARWENIEEDSNKTISNENIIKLAKIFNVKPSQIDPSIKMSLKELIDSARLDGQYIARNCKASKLYSLKNKLVRDMEYHNRDEVCLDILLISALGNYEFDFYYDLLREKTMTSKFITITSSFINGLNYSDVSTHEEQ